MISLVNELVDVLCLPTLGAVVYNSPFFYGLDFFLIFNYNQFTYSLINLCFKLVQKQTMVC
jgi:hypothetical protein